MGRHTPHDSPKMDPSKLFEKSVRPLVKEWIESDETGRCQARFNKVFDLSGPRKQEFIPEGARTSRPISEQKTPTPKSRESRPHTTTTLRKLPSDPKEQDKFLREMYNTTSYQSTFGKDAVAMTAKGIDHASVAYDYIKSMKVPEEGKKELTNFLASADAQGKDSFLEVFRKVSSYKNVRDRNGSTYKADFYWKKAKVPEKNGPDAYASGIVKASDFAKLKAPKKDTSGYDLEALKKRREARGGSGGVQVPETFKSQFTTSQGHKSNKRSVYTEFHGDSNILQRVPKGITGYSFNVSASTNKCIPNTYNPGWDYMVPEVVEGFDHQPENQVKTIFSSDYKPMDGSVKRSKPVIDPYKSQISFGTLHPGFKSNYQNSFGEEVPPRNTKRPQMSFPVHYFKR